MNDFEIEILCGRVDEARDESVRHFEEWATLFARRYFADEELPA